MSDGNVIEPYESKDVLHLMSSEEASTASTVDAVCGGV